jgi:hypothetical protein
MWRLASNKTQFRAMVFWGMGTVLLTTTALVSAQEQTAGERYAKVLAESESLARYNEQLTQQMDAQQSQVVKLEQQLTEIDATAAQMPALIQKMFASLETFLASDLPFLDPTQAGPDSREERMVRIRNLMAKEIASNEAESAAQPADQSAANTPGESTSKPDEENASNADEKTAPNADEGSVSIADKERRALDAERYRRLLEAYQIELDYGRTMISYKGKLEDGREADFVRVGRVSLLYRTADGEESGYWDAQQKKWVVANEYNKAIENTILIATKESAPELIMVPVPAPQEVPL